MIFGCYFSLRTAFISSGAAFSLARVFDGDDTLTVFTGVLRLARDFFGGLRLLIIIVVSFL